jgi:Predicted DNA alkylation repair enzyme
MKKLLKQFKTELHQVADPGLIESGERFFKEEVRLLGIKVPVVKRMADNYHAKIKPYGKAAVFALCEELFKSGYVEETWAACEWAYAEREGYAESDFDIFAVWLEKYVDNWGTCDTLCNHSIGDLLEQYPELSKKTLAWTKSPNR